MHMADALLSPAVGAVFWVASGLALATASRKLRTDPRADLVPLMGVLAAFVFAAQMINFTIPATGSSGHIGGGLLLCILLGPLAAFVALASVLTVQALFFADGGLLALGANLFNMGVCTCFVAYPLIYRPLIGRAAPVPTRRRVVWVTTLAAVLGLQLGALGVVLQTSLSGVSSLPPGRFLLLMQPIHLAIGLIEGVATAALIVFVREARPDLFACDALAANTAVQKRRSVRWLGGFGVLAVITAGLLSWFASSQPDGLEWSIARLSGQIEVATGSSRAHQQLAALQTSTALFANYALASTAGAAKPEVVKPSWPVVDGSKSVAGVVGGVVTLLLVLLLGFVIRRHQRVTAHARR